MNELTITSEPTLRFGFGANWSRFLSVLNQQRIRMAEQSLKDMLAVEDLKDKTFLDVGCGSGLFSLVARRLGARVYSFDYDPESVACAQELKQRYCPSDTEWTIEVGSALDKEYLQSLGSFDIVYSWGVLHHTGAMWQAMENVRHLVKSGGQLAIAIYNDQGLKSDYWRLVKRSYNKNSVLSLLLVCVHTPYLIGGRWLVRMLTNRLFPERGMSLWHDMIDWLGGYPFEVASPEGIHEFLHTKGFGLSKLKTCAGRHGCNEFVFVKKDIHSP
jgi:2-polyprenyl-6-hydroxyphenyl methylase/3-demethylubiquinone-9 3-methyltransferase